MKLLSVLLAFGLVGEEAKARAKERESGPARARRPPLERGRRSMARMARYRLFPLRSPCGRHTVEIEAGAVIVDGRRVHPTSGSVEVLGPPTWRDDGRALAWIERGDGETRLMVLPDLAASSEPLAWPVPPSLARERLHWVAQNRVVVGPAALEPRAVASWSE